MRVLLLSVAGYDERLAHSLAEEIRRQRPGARFVGVTTRENSMGWGPCYMRSVDLFETVVTQSELMTRAAESGFATDDAVLSRLEEEYGTPRLWPQATADRRISVATSPNLVRYGKPFERHEALSILQHRFLGLEALFDDFQPTLVLFVSSDTSPGLASAVEEVAKARGVPLLVPHLARLGDHYILSDTIYSRFTRVDETYRALRDAPEAVISELAAALLQTAQRKASGGGTTTDHTAPYIKQAQVAETFGARVGRWREAAVDAFKGTEKDDLQEIPLRNRMRDSLTRRARQMSLRLSPQSEEVAGLDERYVLFPLHSEPEIALNLYAPYFVDQLTVVRNVAQSLPVNVALYVKEHPLMLKLGQRHLGFYDAIQQIPNVRLVGGDSRPLIAGAEAVVTITGTPGWEAALTGKPVFVLGQVFYGALRSHVTTLAAPRDLEYAFEASVSTTPDPHQLALFVEAITRHSFQIPPGTLLNLRSREEISPDVLTSYIAKVIATHEESSGGTASGATASADLASGARGVAEATQA